MRLAKADPELVSLLDGTAPAGLVADALTGSLSPIPKSPEQRLEASQAQEVAQLLEANPYLSGNLTQAMRLEQLNPEAAARLRKESGVQSPAEKAAAEAAAKQAHEAAMSSVAAAGALRRQQELEQRAAQLPTYRPRY